LNRAADAVKALATLRLAGAGHSAPGSEALACSRARAL